MFKKIVSLLFMLFLSVSLAMAQDVRGKIEVVTTLFPTYDFAKEIGKDKVNVSLLLPPGVEPHAFEPRPQDIVRINRADIFIYTGKYMEPWVHDILKGVSNKKLVMVDASKGIELIAESDREYEEHFFKDSHDRDAEPSAHEPGQEHDHHSEENSHKHAHHHHHEGKDPHIWVDLGNDQVIVKTVAAALVDKDPAHRDFYLENAKEYNVRLAALDKRFRQTLSNCKHKTLIYGGHFVFAYFAKRYNLEYISSYKGFSPDAEPSPKAIAELINKLKESGQKYIYYEELLDPKVARVIAQETGASFELLHGAHNVSKDKLKQGITFIEIMEENLKKLKVGLECE